MMDEALLIAGAFGVSLWCGVAIGMRLFARRPKGPPVDQIVHRPARTIH